jgi:hypothetical protein
VFQETCYLLSIYDKKGKFIGGNDFVPEIAKVGVCYFEVLAKFREQNEKKRAKRSDGIHCRSDVMQSRTSVLKPESSVRRPVWMPSNAPRQD